MMCQALHQEPEIKYGARQPWLSFHRTFIQANYTVKHTNLVKSGASSKVFLLKAV